MSRNFGTFAGDRYIYGEETDSYAYPCLNKGIESPEVGKLHRLIQAAGLEYTRANIQTEAQQKGLELTDPAFGKANAFIEAVKDLVYGERDEVDPMQVASKFGSKTAKAVETFQTLMNIEGEKGVVGPKTWTFLEALVNNRRSDSLALEECETTWLGTKVGSQSKQLPIYEKTWFRYSLIGSVVLIGLVISYRTIRVGV